MGGGSRICQLVFPTICGTAEVTVIQFPDARFVDDCNVKPADATGHDIVRFVPDVERAAVGLFVLNN